YRAQLVIERLTGNRQEGYSNAAMQWGTEQEPFARIAYMADRGLDVQEIGFIQHETLMAGCSPDGLIGTDGLIEIKCPVSATHIETL
ncbi:YqaJ viral recombinase family protein, partial [Pseudomonas aeruginosa]